MGVSLGRGILGLAAAAAIGFTVAPAQAASVSFSAFFPTGNGPEVGDTPQSFSDTNWDGSTQSVSLPQFNPSQGTLTSIGVTLYGNLTTSGSVTNDGAGIATISSYTATQDISLLAPDTVVPAASAAGSLLTVRPTLVDLTPQELTPTQSVTFGQPTAVNSADTGDTTLTSGFDPYIGADNVLFPLFSTTATTTDTSGGNLTLAQVTAARARVTVTYNYDLGQVDVSEPASLELLGAGLFLVGVVGRRRAQARVRK